MSAAAASTIRCRVSWPRGRRVHPRRGRESRFHRFGPGGRRLGTGTRRRATELGGGRVDILVNNAGIFPFGPTPDASDEDINAVYAVNVKAPFILVGELAPAMAARGKGAIINVLTMVAQFGVGHIALRIK